MENFNHLNNSPSVLVGNVFLEHPPNRGILEDEPILHGEHSKNMIVNNVNNMLLTNQPVTDAANTFILDENNNVMSNHAIDNDSDDNDYIPPELKVRHNVLNHNPINYESFDNKVFSCVFQNIAGFNRPKIGDFLLFLDKAKPTMCGVVEHWQKFENDLPYHPQYKCWGSCREDRRRGGVALWIDESRTGKTYSLPMPKEKEHLYSEQVWVQIPKCHIAVAVVYYPPGDVVYRLELLHLILDFIILCESLNLSPIIMGDFNIHDLHVPHEDMHFHIPGMEEEHALMQGIMEASELRVMTDEHDGILPTRVPEDGRADQRPSVLDYVIVPSSVMNKSIKVDEERVTSLYSDHVMISCTLQIHDYLTVSGEMPKQPFECWIKKELRNDATMRQYTMDLEEIWREEDIVEGVQDQYEQIKDGIQRVAYVHFKRMIKPKPRICRMPPEFYKLRSKLRKCRKMIRRHNRYGWPKDELHREEWQLRMEVKALLSRLNIERMQTISQQLNDRSHKNILQFYNYVTRKKTPMQKHFLVAKWRRKTIIGECRGGGSGISSSG